MWCSMRIYTLEFKEVLAICNKRAWSDRSNGIAIERKISTDFLWANKNASDIVEGWRPIKYFSWAHSI